VLKKRKFIIGGVILACALGYLLYLGFGNTSQFYQTISELNAAGETIYGESINVKGKLLTDSVVSDPVNLDYAFTIADDDGGEIDVVYNGTIPDGFSDENVELIVTGVIESDNVLYATDILTQCPSKYESEETSWMY
jgi:cytochrome c-type biogenesis protein CcmE